MARGRDGFFSRLNPSKWLESITKPFEDLFRGKPSRPPEAPEPPPEPSKPSRRERRKRERDAYREEWNAQPGKRGSFQGHYGTFMSMPGVVEESGADRMELWQAYLKYMVAGESQYRRNDPRNPFWNITGYHPQGTQFDWDEWRTSTFGPRGKSPGR